MLSQDAPAGSVRLPSGPFSRVYALEGPKRDVVVKLGPPSSSLREAAALQDVRRLAIAPEVIAVAEGVLVLERMPGETVPPDRLGTTRATALGAVVRRLHDSYVAADRRLAGLARRRARPAGLPRAGRRRRARPRHVRAPRPGPTRARRAGAPAGRGRARLPPPARRPVERQRRLGRRPPVARRLGVRAARRPGGGARLPGRDGRAWAPSSSTPCWRATATPPSASASRPGARSRPSARGSGTPTSASASARRSCSRQAARLTDA